MSYKIRLDEAVRFHGHLGPYLVLGLRAGELALKKLKAKKYIGLNVEVYGADKKPRSCLIDGLQLATGATYGKGNIQRRRAKEIKIIVCNLENKKKIVLFLSEELKKRLNNLRGHSDSEKFARELQSTKHREIFTLK